MFSSLELKIRSLDLRSLGGRAELCNSEGEQQGSRSKPGPSWKSFHRQEAKLDRKRAQARSVESKKEFKAEAAGKEGGISLPPRKKIEEKSECAE